MPRPPRIDNAPAFVLHTYPYRETSLMAEIFSRDYGRLALVAKGARRPRAELRGLIRPFCPLLLSWSGGGEVKTLMKAEWQGGLPEASGDALMSAFYLNELLLASLPREDAQPALYGAYNLALCALAENPAATEQAKILRRFELALLKELGYAMPLTHEARVKDEVQLRAVSAGKNYYYVFGTGALDANDYEADPYSDAIAVSGETLIALAENVYPNAAVALDARRLMQAALAHFFDRREIHSRTIAREIAALKKRRGGQKL